MNTPQEQLEFFEKNFPYGSTKRMSYGLDLRVQSLDGARKDVPLFLKKHNLDLLTQGNTDPILRSIEIKLAAGKGA